LCGDGEQVSTVAQQLATAAKELVALVARFRVTSET
jgi:hypothetical protein